MLKTTSCCASSSKITPVCRADKPLATRIVAAVAGCVLVPFAWADLPAVFDRVPAQTPIVVSMHDIDRTFASIERMGDMFTPPGTTMSELDKAKEFLNKPGFNKNGSMAMLVYPKKGGVAKSKPIQARGDDDEFFDEDEQADVPQADVIALLPVADYTLFVKSLGGEPGPGLVQVMLDDTESFIRDIGSGYAAMSDKRELVEGFKPAEKMLTTHAQAMGGACRRIAESSQVFMIMDMSVMREHIEQGIKKMGDNVEQGAMMAEGADQALESIKSLEKIATDWSEHATHAVVGMGMGERGMWIDLGSQFREGTKYASSFTIKGNAGALVSRLPRQPFLLAGALDMNHPPFKRMMLDMSAKSKDGDAGFSPMSFMSDQADGASFFVGESPGGIAGGVFASTAVFVSMKDPKAHIDAMAAKLNQTQPQNKDGQKTVAKTSYTRASDEVEGTKIDRWQVHNQLDQNDPGFMMQNMVQTMLFGSPIVQGYSASTDAGLITTFSKSKLLMGAMLRASGDNALTSDSDVKAAAAMLPPDRFLEVYVGVKPLLDMVQGAMAMMMPVEFDVPNKISNIAIGASAMGGGVQVRVYLPNDALQAFEAMGRAMREAQGDMMEDMEGDEDDDGAPPRF